MGLMPNHCDNTLVITGPDVDIRRFIHITKCDKEEPYVISQHMPIPNEFKDDGWYAWCCDNWGTKWGDYSTQLFDEPNEAIFHYQTAWGPYSNQFLQKISIPFPTLTFLMQYEERSMEFMGVSVVRNGEILFAEGIGEVDLPEYNEDDEDAYYEACDDVYLKEMDRLTEEAMKAYETNTTVS
jgi:hypothetical protein